MIKQLLVFSLVFFGLYFLGFSIHEMYLENKAVILPFSLQKVYLFHLGFSLLICFNFQLLSAVDKIFPQLGFIYLASLVIKIMVFAIIFYQSIFKQENLSQIARVSLLIPTVIFLSTEAFFVIKILNQKNAE